MLLPASATEPVTSASPRNSVFSVALPPVPLVAPRLPCLFFAYGPPTPQPVMPPVLSLVCCTFVFDCSSTIFAVPFTVRPASSPLGFLIAWQCPRLAALVTLYPSNLRCVTSWVPFSKVSHEQRLLLLSPLALNNHHHRRMTDNDQKFFFTKNLPCISTM